LLEEMESMRVLRLVPRIFALGLLGAPACVVPQTRYEEARSALRVEVAAHRQTLGRLDDVERRLAILQAELAERERRLENDQQLFAQSDLDRAIASKERESAVEIVDQLRNELARVGDHLRVFGEEKAHLSEALDAAEARAERLSDAERAAANSALAMRDLALLLRDPVAVGELELGIAAGRPHVRAPRAKLWSEGSDALSPEGQKLVAAVAKVAALHPTSRVLVTMRPAAKEGQERAALELKKLGDALSAEGVAPSRIGVDVPAADDPAPSTPPAPSAPPSQPSAPAPSSEKVSASTPPPPPTSPSEPQIELSFAFADG
jgi:hypothetical protein